MSRRSLALLAGCLSFFLADVARAAAPPTTPPTPAPPVRVGQIIVVGNERTKQDVILRQVPLYPGQVLSYPDVRQGEANLARLGIFETRPGSAPTITVVDNPENPESEFKDLLVSVQETATGSLLIGVGVNSDSGLSGSIVLEERNLDVDRWPTSFDDLSSGNAFRGAGQSFRLELVLGTHVPRIAFECCDFSFTAGKQGMSIRRGIRRDSDQTPPQEPPAPQPFPPIRSY